MRPTNTALFGLSSGLSIGHVGCGHSIQLRLICFCFARLAFDVGISSLFARRFRSQWQRIRVISWWSGYAPRGPLCNDTVCSPVGDREWLWPGVSAWNSRYPEKLDIQFIDESLVFFCKTRSTRHGLGRKGLQLPGGPRGLHLSVTCPGTFMLIGGPTLGGWGFIPSRCVLLT